MPMPMPPSMKLEQPPPTTNRFEAAPNRSDKNISEFSNPEPPSNFGRDPRFDESQNNFNEPDYFDEPPVSPPRGPSPFESSPLVRIDFLKKSFRFWLF